MDRYFELIDRASGTMLKDYGTELEALRDLKAYGREHGQEGLKGLALLLVENDRPSLVAMEDELIARVERGEPIELRRAWVSHSATRVYVIRDARSMADATDFRHGLGSTATARWAAVCEV
jgi:hypothetical protein